MELPRFRGRLSSRKKGSDMPKTKPPYPAESRRQMVELVQAGRSPAQLAREFDCSAQTIVTWVARVAVDAGKPPPGKDTPTTAKREELMRRRRQAPAADGARHPLKGYGPVCRQRRQDVQPASNSRTQTRPPTRCRRCVECSTSFRVATTLGRAGRHRHEQSMMRCAPSESGWSTPNPMRRTARSGCARMCTTRAWWAAASGSRG